MNRRDWRTITLDDIDVDDPDARHNLFPLLVQNQLTRRKEQAAMLERLITETREALAGLLPLGAEEHAFLDQLIEEGRIRPVLLDLGSELAARLKVHPALLWRARPAER